MRRTGDINKIEHEKTKCGICGAMFWKKHKCKKEIENITDPELKEELTKLSKIQEDFNKEI